MIAVFLGFATDPDPVIKMTGIGLATAVLVDVTLVRLFMAPAALTLLGDRLWPEPAAAVRASRPPQVPERVPRARGRRAWACCVGGRAGGRPVRRSRRPWSRLTPAALGLALGSASRRGPRRSRLRARCPTPRSLGGGPIWRSRR